MSLRDKIAQQQPKAAQASILASFGVDANPFPTSNQTTGNPHFPIQADEEVEDRIAAFMREGKSEVLVVIGTQGVGKTNFLNYFESEIQQVKDEIGKRYIVKYMADPEASFDAIVRSILQELGTSHLIAVAGAVSEKPNALEKVRSFDLREMIQKVSKAADEDTPRLGLEWLLGFRLLNIHRHNLGVNFRLDTVESRTSVLRDYITLSHDLGLLDGIFLLLDELEKQAGVLGPTAVVRYLSALRAIIDALPKHLFMMIAITPDAMRRYASALPAFRSRLENQIELSSLTTVDEAARLAQFYLEEARKAAKRSHEKTGGTGVLISADEMRELFEEARRNAERRGDEGVRQREYLNLLHNRAEERIQAL
jgi:hypothetical protein